MPPERARSPCAGVNALTVYGTCGLFCARAALVVAAGATFIFSMSPGFQLWSKNGCSGP
jgi:hypothetical protein